MEAAFETICIERRSICTNFATTNGSGTPVAGVLRSFYITSYIRRYGTKSEILYGNGEEYSCSKASR